IIYYYYILFLLHKSFLMLSTAQTVSASCPLVMTPSSVVVQYGDAFTVECNSTTDQKEGMGWESNYKGTGLIEADHVQLNSEKVDRWAIQSQCYVNLNNGTQCSEYLPITVYKMPDSVSILHENTKQPLVEHQDYGFECAVANVAPVKKVLVTWIKDNNSTVKECLTEESNEKPGNCRSDFTLSAQKTDNGGTLMCEAKFDFGPMGPNLQPIRSPVMDLQVLCKYFDHVSKFSSDVTMHSTNGKLTLDCTAQGNPTPQYNWQVPQPTQEKVGSEPILDLKGPFSGTYNCTAANSQGSSVKQFVITDAPSKIIPSISFICIVYSCIMPFHTVPHQEALPELLQEYYSSCFLY
uniref:Ig-like domain-containing protein n=1 Tax=Neogobius melanostomus TaxID=47308 RepID=A0A8C6U5G7_9GOBI